MRRSRTRGSCRPAATAPTMRPSAVEPVCVRCCAASSGDGPRVDQSTVVLYSSAQRAADRRWPGRPCGSARRASRPRRRSARRRGPGRCSAPPGRQRVVAVDHALDHVVEAERRRRRCVSRRPPVRVVAVHGVNAAAVPAMDGATCASRSSSGRRRPCCARRRAAEHVVAVGEAVSRAGRRPAPAARRPVDGRGDALDTALAESRERGTAGPSTSSLDDRRASARAPAPWSARPFRVDGGSACRGAS